MKRTAIITLCLFYSIFGTGQTFTWTQNNGTISYDSNLPSSNLHFYMFDDGFYRKETSPKHFYTSGSHETSLYEIGNKEGDDPRKHTRIVLVDPHSSSVPNPHTPLIIKGSAEAKTSWNITQNYFGMILLEFQNDFSSLPSSGCLSLEYDPAILSVTVNPCPMGWATLIEHSSGMITWTYSNLLPDEQRVLYLPANSLLPKNSNFKLTATIADKCSSPRTTTTRHTTQALPHDPNNKLVINTDNLAETWNDQIPESIVPQEVVYRINFHNDGQNYAQNVEILDIIHPDADPGSIQFLSSSHPCTFITDWHLLTINFDDVYLPGAGQNDPQPYPFHQTVGYFEYSICIPERINTLECHDTEAKIFFDAIGPVIAENTICAFDTQIHEHFCNPGNSDNFDLLSATDDKSNTLPKIKMYPMPANEFLRIEGLDREVILNVYNNAGSRQLLEITKFPNHQVLNVESLNQGFYILEIHSGNSTLYEKFIKQ